MESLKTRVSALEEKASTLRLDLALLLKELDDIRTQIKSREASQVEPEMKTRMEVTPLIKSKVDNISAPPEVTQIAEEIPAPAHTNNARNRQFKSLKTMIGINDRFLFANELFGSDIEAFQGALDQLNHIDSAADAERLMEEVFAREFRWDSENPYVQNFKMLVISRYS